MAGYRLYFLGEGGRIKEAVEFECPDDEAALAQADDRREGRAVELWSGARMIAKIEGRPKT